MGEILIALSLMCQTETSGYNTNLKKINAQKSCVSQTLKCIYAGNDRNKFVGMAITPGQIEDCLDKQ